jgi:hypothetical protein
MQTWIELLVNKLGTSLQPFAEDHNTCQHWVTSSWLKLVWEKLSKLGIEIQLAHLPPQPPRERDTWIMAEFIRLNYDTQSLCQLNRVWLYQQVNFLSDVMDASRRAIKLKYLDELPQNKQWSSLIFPKEMPLDSAFKLWKAVLPQI